MYQTSKGFTKFEDEDEYDVILFLNNNIDAAEALAFVDKVVQSFPTPTMELLGLRYKNSTTNEVKQCKLNDDGEPIWADIGGSGSGSGFEIVDVDPSITSRRDLGKAIYNRVEDKYKVARIESPEAFNWEFYSYTTGTEASRPALGYYRATDTGHWFLDNVDITNQVTEEAVEPSEETNNKLYFFDGLLRKGTKTNESYRFEVLKTVGTNDWHYEIEIDNGILSANSGNSVIEYLSDCKNFKPIKQYGGLADDAYGDWDKSGLWDIIDYVTKTKDQAEPNQILHKHYMSKLKNGVTVSDLTTLGNDVFARIGKFYVWIEGKEYEKLSTGIIIPRKPHIHISNKKLNDEYISSTYRIDNNGNEYEAPADYIGVYEASSANSKVYSRSGVALTGSITVENWLNYIKNTNADRGQEMIDAKQYYNLVGIRERNLLWILAMFMAKNKNLRSYIGEGRVKSNNTSGINTGTRNDLGFINGNSNQTDGVKFIIENPWGNFHEFGRDGFYCAAASSDAYKWFFTDNPDSSRIDATFSNYEKIINLKEKTGLTPTSTQQFPKSYLFENNLHTLSLITELGASLSTYMCADWYGMNDDPAKYGVLGFGGSWAYAGGAALLCVYDHPLSGSDAATVARLCIL